MLRTGIGHGLALRNATLCHRLAITTACLSIAHHGIGCHQLVLQGKLAVVACIGIGLYGYEMSVARLAHK